MTRERVGFVVLLIGIAFVGIMFYQQQEELSGLRAELAELKTETRAFSEQQKSIQSAIADEASARVASTQALGDAVEALGQLPTASQVAGFVVSDHLEALVNAQKEALLADSEAVQLLRGAEGKPADPQEVATAIMDDGAKAVASRAADEIYERFGERAFYNETLIAAVAEQVHTRYGELLQPQTAGAAEIAAELAVSDVFATLVARHSVSSTDAGE